MHVEQEVKDSGEVVDVERKLFPGYVLVNMVRKRRHLDGYKRYPRGYGVCRP